ncbi:MAG: hypothetical protein RR853_08215 [Aurantimicrobium sp.]|uniref:hypothetical protein n=1 Tax=Aurantimicrobium sp. TaxID=1930784 RepID=UPI002FCB21CD
MKFVFFLSKLSKRAYVLIGCGAVALVIAGTFLVAVSESSRAGVESAGIGVSSSSRDKSTQSGETTDKDSKQLPSSASPSAGKSSTKKTSSPSPSSSTSRNGNTIDGSSATVQPPSFVNPNTYYNANCNAGCAGQTFYTNSLPEAVGTGPFTYSVSGIPAGVSFDPGSRELIVNANDFWSLNACSQTQGTVWITGPFYYTASGPGGSSTLEMAMNFAMYIEDESRCRTDLWQWYPSPG